jgi:protein-S-isoprenylcysteine O-methyltransferase Ste14
MYTAFLLCGVGILLVSSNAILGLSNLVIVMVMLVVRIPAEERMLVEHFGDDYRELMRSTGRLLPCRLR